MQAFAVQPRCKSRAFTFETKPYDKRHLIHHCSCSDEHEHDSKPLPKRMRPIFRRDLESILAFLSMHGWSQGQIGMRTL